MHWLQKSGINASLVSPAVGSSYEQYNINIHLISKKNYKAVDTYQWIFCKCTLPSSPLFIKKLSPNSLAIISGNNSIVSVSWMLYGHLILTYHKHHVLVLLQTTLPSENDPINDFSGIQCKPQQVICLSLPIAFLFQCIADVHYLQFVYPI